MNKSGANDAQAMLSHQKTPGGDNYGLLIGELITFK